VRRGHPDALTNKSRANGMRQSHLVPAVDYVQVQRVRAMMMRQFADIVSRFDVYVAPYINMRTGAGARASEEGRGEGRGGDGRGGRGGTQTPSAIRDHFQAANICGYPAASVPNGFTADGRPTSITFMGRLFGEAPMLALARAYQEAAGWHRRHPDL
jgi:Asp-tRNA(Asn)/Glu-tRNA(Gln) amidotransferase A subunit family amidase